MKPDEKPIADIGAALVALSGKVRSAITASTDWSAQGGTGLSMSDEHGLAVMSPQLEAFMRHELHVVGATFGVANEATRSFSLLQSEDGRRPRGVPFLKNLGYGISPEMRSNDPKCRNVLEADSEEAALIDYLFLSRRENESLDESPPEFYPLLDGEAEGGGDSWWSTLLSEYPQQSRNRLLLCSAGEVLFFVETWRFLLAHRARGGGSYELRDEVLDSELPPRPVPTCLIGEGWPPETPEHHLTRALHDLAEGSGLAANLLRREERIAALAGWRHMRRRLDVDSSDWLSEWRTLGLWNHAEAAYSLRALLSYGYQLGRKVHNANRALVDSVTERASKSPPSEALQERLGTALGVLEGILRELDTRTEAEATCWLSERLSDGERWHESMTRALHVVSMSVILSITPSLHRRSEIDMLLRQLHGVARFPIVPYYFLVLMYGQVKQQVVFPVWWSGRFRVPFRSTPLLGTNGNPQTTRRTSTAVIVCLATLEPCWRIVKQRRSEARSGRLGEVADTYREMLRAGDGGFLEELRAFAEILARPLIEPGFYGGTLYTASMRTGRSDILHTLPSAFAGAIESLITFQEKNPGSGFHVPDALYSAALGAMLTARKPEEMRKLGVMIPEAVKALAEEGIGERLIAALTAEGRISSSLARARLAREQLFDPPTVSIEVAGDGPLEWGEDLRLADAYVRALAFIGVLVVVLREAIQHTSRYAARHGKGGEVGARESVIVTIVCAQGSITIANPCERNDGLRDDSNQEAEIKILGESLSGRWRIFPARSRDGVWVRSLQRVEIEGGETQ